MVVYDNFQLEEITKTQRRVEDDSKLIDDVVSQIIDPYVRDLDAYVLFIKGCLKDGENPPSDVELDDFSLNLATYIYFASGMCEQLGIRDDISRAIYKEIYHSARASQDKGTVADKDSLAELASQQEYLTNVCYNRSYKIVKAKVENAQELLSAVKKVSSRRMQEYAVTHMVNV